MTYVNLSVLRNASKAARDAARAAGESPILSSRAVTDYIRGEADFQNFFTNRDISRTLKSYTRQLKGGRKAPLGSRTGEGIGDIETHRWLLADAKRQGYTPEKMPKIPTGKLKVGRGNSSGRMGKL